MRESRHLEFKESVSNTFLKTVSAFANYGNGEILFGVADDGLGAPAGDTLRHELRASMEYVIRHMAPAEYPMLEDFLYEAIFVPEGFEGVIARSVMFDDSKCRAAFEGFGMLADDRAVVAVVDERVVGACWVRTTDEYGHIDDETPSFSISLYAPYRGRGLGSAMMRQMLDELREAGYSRASLSVQKENPALRLYERLGFRVVGDGFDETEWLMVYRFE